MLRSSNKIGYAITFEVPLHNCSVWHFRQIIGDNEQAHCRKAQDLHLSNGSQIKAKPLKCSVRPIEKRKNLWIMSEDSNKQHVQFIYFSPSTAFSREPVAEKRPPC
jgi:hypothetical protein